MYFHKIAIIFDHSRRLGKQILPKQNNPIAHLHHLYFITLIKQPRNVAGVRWWPMYTLQYFGFISVSYKGTPE